MGNSTIDPEILEFAEALLCSLEGTSWSSAWKYEGQSQGANDHSI